MVEISNLEALIVRVNRSRDGFYLNITDGLNNFNLFSNEFFQNGETIKVSGSIDAYDPGKLHPKLIERCQSKYSEIEKILVENTKVEEIELLVKDKVMEELKPSLIQAVKKLLVAQKLGRFIFLKFHNDADGISGAVSLTKFIRCQTFQQNSAVYSDGDAIKDLSIFHHEYRPLLVLLDFGANPESEGGLKLLKASSVETLIIDHHPPSEKINQLCSLFVSPWTISTDESTSRFPAGYLGVEMARLAGVKNIEYLAGISCAGDKSTIIEIKQEEKDKALVIDYMATYASYGNNLQFYESVLTKEELFYSMLYQAQEKIASIVADVQKNIKEKQIGELVVKMIELDNPMKKYDFPSRGKITTYIFEQLSSEKPLMVLGYGNKTVIFRLNEQAVKSGYAADKIIEKVKTSMKDFIESGGGHAKAAAIRAKEGYAKTIVDEILNILSQ